MIPKKIHYCWFGNGEPNDLMKKCIASWKEYCPDYEIIEWNESNFDISFCEYSNKAYKSKRYSFLTDIARLKIIYENGGIYLDTDVELRKCLDDLLIYKSWFGYSSSTEINTGSGFGSEAGNPFLLELMKPYLEFNENEPFHYCTEVDTATFKRVFKEFKADKYEMQDFDCVHIMNNIWEYTIHHYTNTWQSKPQKIYSYIMRILNGILKK